MARGAALVRLRDSVAGFLGGLGEGLLETAFPPRCCACNAFLGDIDGRGAALDARYGAAAEDLDGNAVAAAFCDACAESLVRAPAESERRPGPATPGARAIEVAAAFQFGGQLAVAIERLKYGRQEWIARALGRLWRAHLPTGLVANAFDAIVPVPLHPAREGRRGYNQAALLVRAFGLPVLRRAVRRLRDTPPQVGQDRERRRASVAGAFGVARPDLVRGRRLLVGDDVATTGATLGACCAALLEAGAREACAIALAGAD